MAEVIEMPKLSDTMEEGGIASWLKKEGDFIEEGEAFVEIETDKATMEYNSPVEGYLLKILVPAGKTSPLNKPICIVGEKGEKIDDFSPGSKISAPKVETITEPKSKTEAQEVSAKLEKTAKAAVGEKSKESVERLRASPLAKKIAEEKNIDLTAIEGSGPGGRVVVRDIESATVAAKPGVSSREYLTRVKSVGQVADYDDIPVNMMRKTIAKRLLAAKNDAPHFYLTRSVNMKKLNEWREQLNKGADKETKISVNDLLVLVVSRALIKHPEVNSSWQGETVRRFKVAHVAVAVAIPDGLITPVVRNAHAIGVKEIAKQTKDLIGRTKAGKILPEEYAGGTFSISNLGMMGIESFTAIINPPQAAILAIGATIKTPWVSEAGELEIQDRMTMTMSCDHRVVDGAVGASFLQTLTGFIEDPISILA